LVRSGQRLEQLDHLFLTEIPGPAERGAAKVLVADIRVGAEPEQATGQVNTTFHRRDVQCRLPGLLGGRVLIAAAHRALEVPGPVTKLLEAGLAGQVGHDGSFRPLAVRVASRKTSQELKCQAAAED
jgi:hypothetical protein